MRNEAPPTWVKTLVRSLLSSKLIAASALLGAVLLAPGCSDMPTGPSQLAQQEDNLNTNSLDDVFGKAVNVEWTVAKALTWRGGTIQLDGPQLVCTIPNKALPVNSTTITARMRLNGPRGTANRVDMDFQPSMTFKKPIKITVGPGYLAGTGNTLTLWYYDPLQRTWVKQSEKTFTGGASTTFYIGHYSAYALTR